MLCNASVIPVELLKEIEGMYRRFFWGQKKDKRKLAWVAWSKLYKSKKEGGLGLRNLKLFNEALLTKQSWRLIKYPQSLMAKTLKGKYFPNTSLLDAKLSPLASFTWKSIYSARGLLQKGIRKVVGSGLSVEIWNDPWVPDLPQFKPQRNGEGEEEGPRMVSDLVINRGWNLELLNRTFSAWEVKAIIKIPVSHESREDRWAWHHTKNGEFTVRSAYYMAMKERYDMAASTSRSNHGGSGDTFGQHKSLQKLRCLGGIAAKENLFVRGVGNDRIFPVCGEDVETIMHLLVSCAEVRRIWRFSPLRLEIEEVGKKSFREWCESLDQPKKEAQWWEIF